MVKGVTGAGKLDRFAPTPWTKQSEEWLGMDRHLAEDHLARHIAEGVDMLDLGPLFASYLGVGQQALRPDLLLKMVIYEMQNKRPSPAQWWRDARESEPVRWLLFGMEPSRARLYEFRDRIAPFLAAWNAQLLGVAVAEKMTAAARVSLDSSSVAAHASRRQLLNEERLQKRRAVIDAALAGRSRGQAVAAPPGWLAKKRRWFARATAALSARRGRVAHAASGQRRATFEQTQAGRQSAGEPGGSGGGTGARQVERVSAAVQRAAAA